MPIVDKTVKAVTSKVQPSNGQSVSFNIQDTEFMLRLILSSQFDGKDIEPVYHVLSKIKELHTILMGKEEQVI